MFPQQKKIKILGSSRLTVKEVIFNHCISSKNQDQEKNLPTHTSQKLNG